MKILLTLTVAPILLLQTVAFANPAQSKFNLQEAEFKLIVKDKHEAVVAINSIDDHQFFLCKKEVLKNAFKKDRTLDLSNCENIFERGLSDKEVKVALNYASSKSRPFYYLVTMSLAGVAWAFADVFAPKKWILPLTFIGAAVGLTAGDVLKKFSQKEDESVIKGERLAFLSPREVVERLHETYDPIIKSVDEYEEAPPEISNLDW